MIKFSIITVCLNAGNDLLETVESTLKQSYDEFEIIVKDGFSKDGSIEKLPQNKKVCVYQERDKNVYDAMNQAIAYATGDYSIRVHSYCFIGKLYNGNHFICYLGCISCYEKSNI